MSRIDAQELKRGDGFIFEALLSDEALSGSVSYLFYFCTTGI